jgi:uncharacterized membrane protein
MTDRGSGFDPVEGDVFEKLPVLVVFATLAVAIVGNGVGAYAVTAPLVALGFVIVLPLSFLFKDDLRRLLGREPDPEDGPDPTNDALDELQRMYARGELSEAEFERRTARILENEDLQRVQSRVEREGETDEEPEFER